MDIDDFETTKPIWIENERMTGLLTTLTSPQQNTTHNIHLR